MMRARIQNIAIGATMALGLLATGCLAAHAAVLDATDQGFAIEETAQI